MTENCLNVASDHIGSTGEPALIVTEIVFPTRNHVMSVY